MMSFKGSTTSHATAAQNAPTTKKKRGKKGRPSTDKVALPDVIPLVDTFNSGEENSVLHYHRGSVISRRDRRGGGNSSVGLARFDPLHRDLRARPYRNLRATEYVAMYFAVAACISASPAAPTGEPSPSVAPAEAIESGAAPAETSRPGPSGTRG